MHGQHVVIGKAWTQRPDNWLLKVQNSWCNFTGYKNLAPSTFTTWISQLLAILTCHVAHQIADESRYSIALISCDSQERMLCVSTLAAQM